MMSCEKKVLVTGCAGFIGSHTAEELLRRGTSVVGVDIMSDYYDPELKLENLRILRDTAAAAKVAFTFYQADVAVRDAMEEVFRKEVKVDSVCHLAARAGVRPSLLEPELYVQTNVQGTVVLLDLARKYGVRNFVYASSSSVYGGNTKVPFAETDPVDHPVSPYAATKRACELMAATYHQLYQLPVTGLRFFTVYGPRGRPDMAPFKFVDRISRGLPVERFGDGTTCRDYTYIDDIVSGVIAALDHPLGCEIVNLGNSHVVSLNDFIALTESLVGKKAVIKQLPNQPGDVPLTYADCTKAHRLLGYEPQFDIKRGMECLVRWYAAFYRQRNEASDEVVKTRPVAMPPASSSESSPMTSEFEFENSSEDE